MRQPVADFTLEKFGGRVKPATRIREFI